MSGTTLSSGTSGTTTGGVELTESAGRALKLQTDAPHLVSMGGDRLSTAVTLHPIPQGRLTLGSGAGVDIPVHGTGVLPLHCHIDNYDGVVTLYPVSGNLSVDGVLVCGPTRLSQGVMLTIGRSNYMRFNHPAEAKLMKSVLPNSRISMAPITFENDAYQSNKFTKKPPVAPRKSPRGSLSDEEPPPSNIMTKVSKFEYLAAQNFKKSISPKVFSSNLVTVNTPAKDVLGKAPPDLHNFAKNISQPAVNYMDKQKNKTPDRQIFGCKSSYVNVSIQETKSINNKVVIFENGCIPKQQNVTYEQPHELNNITRNYNHHGNKNVNICKGTPPPPFLKNPGNRCITPNTGINNGNVEERLSGSAENLMKGSCNVDVMDDLAWRKNEAELRRNQAQVDRIKEQEIEKAEQQRLEEILTMFAEYDKQMQTEKANKPTPNRIKTNGSLPRDKRTCISPNLLHSPNQSGSPGQSNDGQIFRFEKDHVLNFPKPNNSYENVSINQHHQISYENVEIRKQSSSVDLNLKSHMSTYENVTINTQIPQSPRTKIKTFIPQHSKDSSKEALDALEAKHSPLGKSDELLSNRKNQEISATPEYKSKTLPPKFILPYAKHLENYENLTLNNHSSSLSNSLNLSHNKENENPRLNSDADVKVEKLKGDKIGMLSRIAKLKRQMAEMENQSEELNRELELEKALIIGEYKSKQLELEKLETRREKLILRAQKIDEKMNESQAIQEQDQKQCKQKLHSAQEHLTLVENRLAEIPKGTPEHDATFEELLIAQEELDNERKTFEDLEFHHLEEEADWLASREEIQREIVDLTKKIDDLSIIISDLDKENSIASNSNADEYSKIEEKRLEFSKQIEELRYQLKMIDTELINLNNKETDDDVSTDSDSDKKNASEIGDFSKISDLSCSYIISSTKIMEEDFNMSRSFNEKMLQEKSILDDGLGRKFPSQDDIDRISKVTIDAPINIDEGRGSLGTKTIESLKEIERIRQIHLVQQGSQVIENERRRVLALKQKVQNEVRSTWAQRKQDCESYNSTESDEARNRIADHAEIPKQEEEDESTNNLSIPNQPRTESEDDSPRPLSETSDISMDVGSTLSRRRGRTTGDKHRPLTRYLPIRSSELDLRQHIESAGHQADLCPHVKITTTSCRGFLHKKGSKLNGWSRRWFVFDRVKRHLAYYADKSEKKIRGGALFEAIEEVYLDHANSVKSPNPQLTFVVKTHQRYYYLMAPSPEAMRIWIDVIFTGAEGYQEFDLGT